MKEVKERFPMASSLITKKRIAKAFRDLLATREFDKISIVEIMELAGIRRQTFYNHFLDKYELLDWIFENDLREYGQIDIDSSAYTCFLLDYHSHALAEIVKAYVNKKSPVPQPDFLIMTIIGKRLQ